MANRSKLFWGVALIASGVVGGGIIATYGTQAEAPEPSERPRAVERTQGNTSAALNRSGQEPPTPSAELESRWQLGASSTYDGDYSTWVDQTNIGANLVAITASGPLSVTVVKDDGKERLLEVSLKELAISFTDEATDLVTTQQVRRDAQRPYYVKLTHKGTVPGIFVPRERSPHSDRMMRNIAGVLQLVRASNPKATRWSSEELGANGRYLAHYTSQGNNIEKRKDKAVLSDSAPVGTKIDSASTYVLDGAGAIERVAFTETAHIPFGLKKVTAFENINLVLMRARLTQANEPTLTDYVYTPLDKATAPSEAERTEASDKELAAGQTFAGLTQQMRQLAEVDRDRYLDSRERLIALLRTNPSAIAECKDALRGELSPEERASLMGALANADTPEAQAALVDLARDPSLPAEVRERAMINVSLTETPTEDTVSALAELSKDTDPELRAQATLALGAASGTAQQGTDTSAAHAAESAIAELSAGFESAASPQDKLTYASALGNVGGDAALQSAQAALASEDEIMRAQGASNLRLVEDGKADSMLAELLVDDPSPLVRSRAAAATHFRDQSPELLTALDATARTDEDASVRHSALSALSSHVRTSDEARAAVEWVAENDPDEGLRRAASEALSDPSEESPVQQVPDEPASADPERPADPEQPPGAEPPSDDE